MATLRFCDETGDARTVTVGPTQPEVLVGRNAECLLRTRNNTVSRLHAKVWWSDGVYRVRDLDSANGTWCDRRRVKETELADGVEVTFGAFTVTFTLDPDERAVPVADGGGARGTAGYESGALSAGTGGLRDAATMVDRPALPDAGAPILVDPATDGSDRPPSVPGTAAFDAFPEESPETPAAVVDEAPTPPEEPGASAPDEDADESPTQADEFASALAEAESRIVELERALADRDGSVARLGLQVEELTNCLSAREEEREAAARHADKEASSAEDARQALAEARQALGEARAEVAALSTERDGLLSERDERLFEREALAARVAELEASAQAEVPPTSPDLEVQAALSDALATLAEVRNALTAAQEQGSAASLERDALGAERDGLLSERDALASERDALASRVAELEAAAQAEVPPASPDLAAQAALSDAEQALAEVRQALATAHEQMATLTTERDALVDETRRWDSLKAAFEGERSALQVEVERLRPLAEKAGAGPDEALAARVDSMAKELQEAVAEVASLRTANRAYVKRIARLLQGGAEDRGEATGTALPPVEESPTGADGAAQRDAFKASLERINDRVSEMRTSLGVLSGLLPEVLERVPDDDEAAEQLRAALEELVSGNREVKSEVLAARQTVS